MMLKKQTLLFCQGFCSHSNRSPRRQKGGVSDEEIRRDQRVHAVLKERKIEGRKKNSL